MVGPRLLFIFLNILEAILLSFYISAVKHYKTVFKDKADPITIKVMILIAIAMFCKVIIRLPTEVMLLYDDVYDTDRIWYNSKLIGILREASVYIMLILLHCSAFLNVTRWIGLIANISDNG